MKACLSTVKFCTRYSATGKGNFAQSGYENWRHLLIHLSLEEITTDFEISWTTYCRAVLNRYIGLVVPLTLQVHIHSYYEPLDIISIALSKSDS